MGYIAAMLCTVSASRSQSLERHGTRDTARRSVRVQEPLSWAATAASSYSSIDRLTYDSGFEADGVAGEEYVLFAMLDGHIRLRMNGNHFDLLTGHGAIVEPECAFALVAERPTSMLVWKVRSTVLEREALLMTGSSRPDAVRFEPMVHFDRGKGRSLFRALRFVARELQDDGGVAHSAAVHRQMDLMLVRALLDAQPSQISEALSEQTASVVPRCVLRVERYIAEHLDGKITIADMAAASGVGARTMLNAFKIYRGKSPLACARDLRMRQIRADLLNASPGAKVTEVLTKRGITQFGRFAVAYKRTYGESPSQTIKR